MWSTARLSMVAVAVCLAAGCSNGHGLARLPMGGNTADAGTGETRPADAKAAADGGFGETGMNRDGALDIRPNFGDVVPRADAVGQADRAVVPLADAAGQVDSAVVPLADAARALDAARAGDDTSAVCSTCAIDAATDKVSARDSAGVEDRPPALADSATPDALASDADRDSTQNDGADNLCCDGTDPHCDSTRLPAGNGPNPGQFLVSADGQMVADTITEMFWQRDGTGPRPGCSEATTCTWQEALAYCADLSLGGYTDWRLPHVKELRTIVDFSQSPVALDPVAFPHTTMSYFFWTADISADSADNAWGVLFGNGAYSIIRRTDAYSVRCVRGSHCAPAIRFIVEDVLVRDTVTERVWQRDGAGSRMGCSGTEARTCTWEEAQAYCQDLVLGGFDDFRLPTMKELDSLVDFTAAPGTPTIDATTFPDIPSGSPDASFWSSTIHDENAWRTDFANAEVTGHPRTSYGRVRCVR